MAAVVVAPLEDFSTEGGFRSGGEAWAVEEADEPDEVVVRVKGNFINVATPFARTGWGGAQQCCQVKDTENFCSGQNIILLT